jgi:hypothetical protein
MRNFSLIEASFLKVIGILLALLALIGIGVGVGVGVSQSHKSSSSSLAAAESDPSTFDKDPNLHRAFYGIAYTPEGSQLPDCGANLSACIFYLSKHDFDPRVQRTSSKISKYAHICRFLFDD